MILVDEDFEEPYKIIEREFEVLKPVEHDKIIKMHKLIPPD